MVLSYLTVPAGAAIPKKALQNPEFYISQMEADWHPGKMCVQCHFLIPWKKLRDSVTLNCEPCHVAKKAINRELESEVQSRYGSTWRAQVKFYKNETKIPDLHANKNCNICHGLPYWSDGNVDIFAEFHTLHTANVTCFECHKKREDIVQGIDLNRFDPLKKQCFWCHGETIHVVHARKLTEVCPTCHGEWGEQYNISLALIPESDFYQLEYIAANSSNFTGFVQKPTTLSGAIREIVDRFFKIWRGLIEV